MKAIEWCLIGAVLVLLYSVGVSWADDKKTSCPEQLNDVTMQAYNLDADRDAKERALAKSQVTVYQLQKQVAQLQAQIDAMKKADEKPKE